MAPKRQRKDTTSSSKPRAHANSPPPSKAPPVPPLPTYDQRRFVSEKASNNYHDKILPKSLITKRGFAITRNYQEIIDIIKEKGWEKFFVDPGCAVIPLVREFYANAEN